MIFLYMLHKLAFFIILSVLYSPSLLLVRCSSLSYNLNKYNIIHNGTKEESRYTLSYSQILVPKIMLRKLNFSKTKSNLLSIRLGGNNRELIDLKLHKTNYVSELFSLINSLQNRNQICLRLIYN